MTPKHYAYVKVAEGCDYACAFCIIPTLRGHYRSRTPESIVTEARRLADRGVRELLLISQDTTFFGVDRGERGALARLLRDLNRVDGLEWIRLLYLYPTTITDDVLDAMAESDKVCKYVDLPLQHAAPGVLKRMKRPGTGATYRRLLDRIRTRVPGVALRTTLIVGFPGETADEFETLKSFVQDVRFDHLGVFTYSHEEGTSAYAPRRRRAGPGEAAAADRADERAETARAEGPAGARGRAGARDGGRPVARARPGPPRPPGEPGPGHRLLRLPDRRGPVGRSRPGASSTAPLSVPASTIWSSSRCPPSIAGDILNYFGSPI